MPERARHFAAAVVPSSAMKAPLGVEVFKQLRPETCALHESGQCLEVVKNFVIRFVRRIDEQTREQLTAAARTTPKLIARVSIVRVRYCNANTTAPLQISVEVSASCQAVFKSHMLKAAFT